MSMRIVHAVLRKQPLMLAFSFSIALGVAATKTRGAERASSDGLWRGIDATAAGARNAHPRIEPDVFRLVSLDQNEGWSKK